MLSLKQIQWFSFKIVDLNCCLFNAQLHNLKRTFLYGKILFYNSFLTVMRTRLFSKTKKSPSKRLKLQMMAAAINSKCNKAILKTESTTGARVKQFTSNSAPNRLSSGCSKEENTRDRRKESIKSGNESKNGDKKYNTINPSKRSNEIFTSFVNTVQQQASIPNNPLPVVSGSLNWRHSNTMWPPSYDNLMSRSVPVMNSLMYNRSFSDSRVQQRHLNSVYLNNSAPTNNHYNRYHMRRSNTVDSSNRTSAAERDKQLVWALRSWQRTPYGKKFGKQKKTASTCHFKVMSYNVLAQELLTEHSYLYRNHNARALLWEERWSNLFKEIQQHDADILCLQEVQSSHLESYFSELKKLGYDSLYKQRTGFRTDGCAIYYKTSMFNLIEYATVEFNQTDVNVLNRDNVAIIAKFSPKQNPGNEFVVATTHLLYNPRREDVRLAQVQVLLSEVDRMSYKKNSLNNHWHLPIIITGDFNLTPNSAVYELITQGILQYEHLTNKSLSRGNTTFANITGKFLLPSSLRVTDECQHADLVEHRKDNSVLTREEELKLVQLQHSERLLNNKCSKKFNKSMFSTGTLSHHLSLKSAYEHRHGDAVEATTFQDKWVTVDYIFYSGVKDENDLIKESKLKLISRYTIPTTQQLQGVRIPNFALGSDHLSLLVKFQLEP